MSVDTKASATATIPVVDPRFCCKQLTKLPPETERVFESYCNISKEDTIPHIFAIRDKAFKIYPWLTIGGFRFLESYIALHPRADEIVSRLKDDGIFLDVGCGFAQDIRILVSSGLPARNLYGCDIDAQFLEIGYELFRDKEALQPQFFVYDLIGEEQDSSVKKSLDGRVDVIQAAHILHCFCRNAQKMVAARLLRLLSPKKGSMIVGRQYGNVIAGEYHNPLAVPNDQNSETMFRHNTESIERFWKELDPGLIVEAELRDFNAEDAASGLVVEDWVNPAELEDPNNRYLIWSVQRM